MKYPTLKPCLLAACLIGSLTVGCAEGIVLNPTQTFPEREIALPTPEPTPTPEPSTPVEKAQYKLEQAVEAAKPYRGLFWPLLALLAVLWGFFQLLRLIFELTTTSPV